MLSIGILQKNLNSKISYSEFFHSLGYRDDERIFLRWFKDQGKKDSKRNYDTVLFDIEKAIPGLQELNRENHGIFYVVNGGGQQDGDVKRGRALFIDFDDFPFREQIDRLNRFPFEPSIIVKTRKSLHCYWILEEEDDPDLRQWQYLQNRMINHFGSDRSIENPSRIMRLYGFEHRKQDPVLVTLVKFSPDIRYRMQQFQEILPPLTDEQKADIDKRIEKRKGGKGVTADYAARKIKAPENSSLETFARDLKIQWLEDWAERHDIGILGEVRKGDGSVWYGVTCPWADEHTQDTGELQSCISVDINGVLGYSCLHSHCKGRHWKEFRAKVEETDKETAADRLSDYEPGDRIGEIAFCLASVRAEKLNRDELSAAKLYSQIFSGEHRYNQSAKDWFVYDAGRWRLDAGGLAAVNAAKLLAEGWIRYAAAVTGLSDDERKNFLEYCGKWLTVRKRETTVKDARDINVFRREDMDTDPSLLNVKNGVLHFTDHGAEFRPHSPDYLMSKIAGVKYDPDADCPRFRKFISEIMQDDRPKIRFLQTFLSLGLIGEAPEDKLVIEYGATTRNGKSTLNNVIMHVLGDYAVQMNPETIAQQKADSRRASGDVARLAGCRFVVSSELPKNMLMNSQLVKQMTGGDNITARHLTEREFEFKPQFVMVLNSNHLPIVSDQSVFESNRVCVLEFGRHFTEAEQDKRLESKLKAEGPGILNWLIEGLEIYRIAGLVVPETVAAATKDYANSSDKIMMFLDECLTAESGKFFPAGTAYIHYSAWSGENGFATVSKSTFMNELRLKNLLAKSATINGQTVRNVIRGYGSLVQEEENPFQKQA